MPCPKPFPRFLIRIRTRDGKAGRPGRRGAAGTEVRSGEGLPRAGRVLPCGAARDCRAARAQGCRAARVCAAAFASGSWRRMRTIAAHSPRAGRLRSPRYSPRSCQSRGTRCHYRRVADSVSRPVPGTGNAYHRAPRTARISKHGAGRRRNPLTPFSGKRLPAGKKLIV
jgi:hypothetical protein